MNANEILKRLKAIAQTKAFNNIGIAGTKKRIEFVTHVVEGKLWRDMVAYVYYDSHGVGERTLDTCFEMFDSEHVVAALIEKANKCEGFKNLLIEAIGKESFNSWTIANMANQDPDSFVLF